MKYSSERFLSVVHSFSIKFMRRRMLKPPNRVGIIDNHFLTTDLDEVFVRG